jgi:hypothetical protein
MLELSSSALYPALAIYVSALLTVFLLLELMKARATHTLVRNVNNFLGGTTQSYGNAPLREAKIVKSE